MDYASCHRSHDSVSTTMSSSARVPFVPLSRPASRAAHLKDQPQNPTKPKTNLEFVADVVNPLHTSSNTQLAPAKPQQQSHADANVVSQPKSASVDKSLNIGGLMKKKNIQTTSGPSQNSRISRRPSFPGLNPASRPGTADPHSNQNQNQNQRDQILQIVAPIPRPAPRPSTTALPHDSASDVFSLAPPTPRNQQSASSQLSQTSESIQHPKEAHTPTSGLGFSFNKAHMVTEQHRNVSKQLPSPPDTVRMSSASVFASPSAVKPDYQDPLPPFILNMSLPNQTGPQRVLLNPGGTGINSENTPFDQGSNPNDHGNGHGNRVNQDQQLKRPRAELEHDERNREVSDDRSGHPKRYKDRSVRVSSLRSIAVP